MARVADDLRADPKRRWGMAARSEREWERLFGANLAVARRQLDCRAFQRSPAICSVRSASSGRTGQIDPFLPVKTGSMNAREARESGLRLKA
jgi:hypothetical protein